MNDLNSVVLIGRIAGDPETKVNGNGNSFLIFTLANNRSFVHKGQKSEEANFIRICLWGRQAEPLKEYLVRGRQVGLRGRLHQFSFTAADGKTVSMTEVVASSIQFLSRPGKKEQGPKEEESCLAAGEADEVKND